MIGLMVVIERGVDRHHLDQTMAMDWRRAGQDARREAPGCNALAFGDSLVKVGVVPSVVEARSGLKTFNLALSGAQAPTSYFMLRRALRAGAHPDLVVVDFMPAILSQGLDYGPALRRWPDLASPGEALELAFAARDGRFLAATLLAELLPSLKDRETIRANVLVFLRGGTPIWRSINLTAARNMNKNRGALVLPASAFQPRPDHFAIWSRDALASPRSCHPLQERYVRKFLALAAERGIPVVWLLPQIAPEAQALCEREGMDARLNRFVRRTAAEYANVVVVDARRAGYLQSDYSDISHLNRLGASVFSADLGDALKTIREAGPNGPRWVELEACSGPTANVAVEDFDESRRVVLGLAPAGVRR
jgi:hypothetical protein